jgi:starch phosphorylase
MVVAGKAHPLDDNAKQMLVDAFGLSQSIGLTSRVVFLEDYDLSVAAPIVGGCDVWLNVPRPPQEASGTSGMKSAANGGLNLSVLDGWWVEGYDGENGWEIDGGRREGEDEAAQDARHAHALYDLLEQEVIPLFHERDADGIPRRWLAMVKRSLATNGPRFSAARMVGEYAERIYPVLSPSSEPEGAALERG